MGVIAEALAGFKCFAEVMKKGSASSPLPLPSSEPPAPFKVLVQ